MQPVVGENKMSDAMLQEKRFWSHATPEEIFIWKCVKKSMLGYAKTL